MNELGTCIYERRDGYLHVYTSIIHTQPQTQTHTPTHTHTHRLIDCIVAEDKLLQQEPHTDGLPPAQQMLPSLKQDQYTLLHGVLDNPAQVLTIAKQFIQEHDQSNLSNGPKLERTSDRKRKSVSVERDNPSPSAGQLRATLVACQTHLARVDKRVAMDKTECFNEKGALFFEELTVLISLPGCVAQAPHTDHDAQSALSIIIALQDDTSLWMWPRGPGVQGGNLDFREIQIPTGGAVVFAGNAFHCGAPYTNWNIRLHCYIDSIGEERHPNQTYVCPQPPPSLTKPPSSTSPLC